MSALQLQEVSIALGGSVVLSSVSLTLAHGELVALIGPNGAGKSTLFKVAAGDLVPDRGRVLLNGEPLAAITTRSQARRRSVQTQQQSVSYAYLVGEVVAMGRWPWQSTEHAHQDGAAITAAIRAAHVEHLERREITTLSGGEQSRAAFARLLAQQTRLVLADEPTAALDIGHQEVVLGQLCALRDQGAAVLVVLHDLNLAASFADRVVLVDRGRVVAQGPPQQVLEPARLSEVYQTPIDVLAHPRTGQPLVLPRRDQSSRIIQPGGINEPVVV